MNYLKKLPTVSGKTCWLYLETNNEPVYVITQDRTFTLSFDQADYGNQVESRPADARTSRASENLVKSWFHSLFSLTHTHTQHENYNVKVGTRDLVVSDPQGRSWL